jgi:CDP-L-myo-inositol myo-inositolphosphotransferase
MKALIIAAGRGRRLNVKEKPKPIVRLLGLPIILRVILAAKEAGIKQFIIVTGYKGEMIKEELGNGSKYGIEIDYVENEQWERGNGISVLKAKELLNENFILLMSDHIFDKNIIKNLINLKIKSDEIILAADHNLKNKLIDVNDVTKVLVKDGMIQDIGKEIKKYNAYDTGIFQCTPALFNAIEESVHNGDDSLTGAVMISAAKKNAYSFDIKNNYWVDIDNKVAYRKAKKLLLSSLTKPHDGVISKYINRKFSTKIFTPLFLKICGGITPNQLSLITFIMCIASSMFFISGHPIVGAIIIQLASILDGCDGEIARLKYMQSSLGDYFDAILDRYGDGFIILGIFYYTLNSLADKAILGVFINPSVIMIIAILAVLGHFMVSYTSAKSVVNFGYKYKGKFISAGKGRDFSLFLLFMGGILAYFHPVSLLLALLILAIRTNTIVIWRLVVSYNLFGKERFFANIKAVIFDFDGTIAYTMPFLTELAINSITEKCDISLEEARRKYIETTGLSFGEQIDIIFPDHPANKEIVRIFELEKERRIFNYPLCTDVLSTLRYIKGKGMKIFICSSTREEIITKYCKLNKIFDLIDSVSGFKDGFKKSKQIDLVIKNYHLKEEVLFIGDSLKDYELAKDKGIKFIGITGVFKKGEFEKRGTLSVDNLKNIIKGFKIFEKVD